jgi:hypothetical protein
MRRKGWNREGLQARSEAQLVAAREGGFESWPKLVKQLEQREIRAFKNAVNHGGAVPGQRILTNSSRSMCTNLWCNTARRRFAYWMQPSAATKSPPMSRCAMIRYCPAH